MYTRERPHPHDLCVVERRGPQTPADRRIYIYMCSPTKGESEIYVGFWVAFGNCCEILEGFGTYCKVLVFLGDLQCL